MMMKRWRLGSIFLSSAAAMGMLPTESIKRKREKTREKIVRSCSINESSFLHSLSKRNIKHFSVRAREVFDNDEGLQVTMKGVRCPVGRTHHERLSIDFCPFVMQ